MNKALMRSLPGLALLALLAVAPAAAAIYNLDVSHSEVGFQVKHLAISKVSGKFSDFTGRFEYEAGQPASWSCEAVIQATSVNTGNGDRDDHLRSPDFFDVEKFPTITFKSTGVTMTDDSEGTVTGDLTLHGVTKSVELALEVNGIATDPWGNERAGFSVSGDIDRKEFGLTWSKALETGGLVVGEKVKLVLEIEGIKAK